MKGGRNGVERTRDRGAPTRVRDDAPNPSDDGREPDCDSRLHGGQGHPSQTRGVRRQPEPTPVPEWRSRRRDRSLSAARRS
jgi:hypothetical protein